jgi:hypothetical protein
MAVILPLFIGFSVFEGLVVVAGSYLGVFELTDGSTGVSGAEGKRKMSSFPAG